MRRVTLSKINQYNDDSVNKDKLLEIYAYAREQVVSDNRSGELLNKSIRGIKEAEEELRALLWKFITDKEYSVENMSLDGLLDYLCDNIYGYGPAQKYMADPDISEILVNGSGPDEPIIYEKQGYKHTTNDYFIDDQQLVNTITRMLFPLGETVNEGSAKAETSMPDGSRLTVVIPPVAINGPSFAIRRFYETVFTPEQYIEMGSISEEMLRFISMCVKGRANILVCGGTSAGKTSLLKTICNYIPMEERIITIEDTAELQLKKYDPKRHVLALLAQKGKSEFSIRDCLLLSLRERPDRIIVGEVRGAESVDLLDAMRTGHESMGTLHVSTPVEAVERLGREIRAVDPGIDAEILYDEIARTVDIIIQLKFFKNKGKRIIVSITEPTQYKGRLYTREIFKYTPNGFVFNQTISKSLSEKILLNGVTEIANTPWLSDEFTEEEKEMYLK